MSLEGKARELLAEARAEAASADRRKAELVAERDTKIADIRARIADVRAEYKAKFDEVDEVSKVIGRLERALDPPKAGRPKGSTTQRNGRNGSPEHNGRHWTPKRETRDQLLAALSEDREQNTASEIARRLPFSEATAKYAIDALRDDGEIRLAAQGRGGRKFYAITPKGRERLAEVARVPEHMRGGYVPPERVLAFVNEHGKVRTGMVVQAFGCSKDVAQRRLATLVEFGAVGIEGDSPSARVYASLGVTEVPQVEIENTTNGAHVASAA